jgi:hypothetical protein
MPALLLAAVAACTTAAHTAAPSTVPASTTTTTVDYGAQYLAVTGPATDAFTRLEATTSPTAADFQSAESASETLPTQLVQASWPTNDEPDIMALTADWEAVTADLRLQVFDPTADTTTLRSDASRLSAAVRVVKRDLRLPT